MYPRKNALRTGAVAAALGLLLTGCSGGDEGGSKTDGGNGQGGQGGSTTSAPTSVDPGRVSPADMPVPPTVKGAVGAKSDLTLGRCDTEAGNQIVSGSIKSSATKTTDYLVQVSWINNTYDVRGLGYAVLKGVKPGSTEKFQIKAKVASGATQCAPNVQYGTVKGS